MTLALRVSWICLLLFSIGACFPVDSPNNPFTFSLLGPEPPSGSLQHEAAGQQTGSQTGIQSPRGLGAPGSSAGFPSDYEPGPASDYGSSSDPSGAAAGRSLGSWYPSGPPRRTPDLPPQQQSGPAGGGGSVPGFDASFYSGSSGPDPFGFQLSESFLKHMFPNRLFPDPDAWEAPEVPLGMIEPPPVVPSSYIVQSSNGYQRARELLSHSKYSPDIFDHFLLPPIATQTPTGTPVAGTPGQKAR